MLTVIRRCVKLFCVVMTAVLFISRTNIQAANLTWDSDGIPPVTDGNGFWDTTNADWFNGTNDVVWDNVSTAVFGAGTGTAPYAVTIDDLSGTVTAAGLTFNSAGTGSYTIAASGIDTLTLRANPVITLAAGVGATISAPITGSFGNNTGTSTTTGLFIKSLGGNDTSVLTLSGTNTYTGSTVIESSGTANTGTAVALTGGSIGSSGSNFYIAFNPTAAATDTSSLTMSGTSTLTAATLTLDYNFGEGAISTTSGGVLNVNGTNTINANTITTTAGRANGNTKGGLGTLVLGNGATLALNDAANDGGPVSLLDIANYSFENGGATGTGTAGIVDFSSGAVTGKITTVNVATGKANAGTTSGDAGPATGTLTFGNGSLTIGTLNIARLGSENSVGTVTLAAGTTGVMTVGNGTGSQAITFGATGNGTQNNLNTKATGALNINGGTLNVNGDIVANPNGSSFFTTSTSTINVNGGTLNLQGNNIGPSGNAISLIATAGTIENVGSINASGNGSAGITMSGTGAQVLTLSGINAYSGNTTVNGGVLIANGPQSMGNGSGALAVNGGTLDLFGNSQSVTSLSGTGASSVITSSVASPITLTVTNGVPTSSYAGVIQDGGAGKTVGLTVSGGSVNLTSTIAQTYSGNTVVNSGASLAIANINSSTAATVNGTLAAAGTVGTILVDNGGSLTPGPTVASGNTGTLNASSLTIGPGGGSLNFLANSASSFDKLMIGGTALLNGSLTVNATMNGSMPSGTYDLLTAAGGLNLNGNTVTGNVTVGGGGATRVSGSIIETLTKIQLQVSGNPANLTWTGAADTTSWDIGASGHQNWTSSAPTDPNRFYNQDSVTFGNSVNLTVDISSAMVLPASVNFANDASHNYMINSSGSFGIGEAGSGTTLSLNGLGSVTLNTVNIYAGATNVNSGQLIIGSTGAIAGSTLAIASSATATVNTSGSVTSTAINANGNLFVGGSVAGTTLTISNSGGVTVTSGGNVSTTTANVNGGSVIVQGSGTLSSSTLNIAGSVTVQPSGSLGSTSVAVSNGALLAVQSGGSVTNTPNLTNNGTVTFNSDQAIHSLNGTDTTAVLNETGTLTVSGGGMYAGTIHDDGPGSLTVAGGTLVLTGANPYTGNTTINSGATLQVDAGSNTGSLSATTAITDNGTLIYARTGPQTLGNTLTGTGAFQQTGGDTFTLTANNGGFSGAIQVYNGTILQSSVTSLGTGAGGFVLGTPEPAGAGSNTLVGNITLISSVPSTTVGSISSTTGNTAANPTPSILTIPTGVTLTDSGALTVGPGDSTSGVFTTLVMTGGGALVANGTINVAQANSTAILDFSGLNSVTVNTANVNILGAAGAQGTLNLANTTVGAAAPFNSITATTALNIATTGINNPGGSASVLNLGSGVNDIFANAINLGSGRGAGVIQFAAGAPATASVNIADSSGTGSATIILSNASTNGTQTAASSLLSLAGFNANVMANSLIIAENTGNLDGGASAAVTFDKGTFVVNNAVVVAADTGGSSLIGPTGSLTIGGTSPNNTATGTFTANGIMLGDFTNTNAFADASATASATFTINGGTANINGSITNASTRGNTVSTLNLNSGTLNMNQNQIGGNSGVNSGNGPITVNLPAVGQTATLANLGGGGINGAGLTMNGGGTLRLAGTNNYNSGTSIGTTVSSGSLILVSPGAIDSTGAGVALTGGNLGTGGFNQSIPGSLTLSTSGHLDLGLGGQGPVASVVQGNVHFNASSTSNQGITWSGALTIDNWTPGIDHLFFGSDNTGLDPSQVSEITFTNFGAAQILATGEIVPQNFATLPTFVLGDVNGDGHYNAADILAEEKALTNLSAFQSNYGPNHLTLNADELDAVLDQNHDGLINNADIQALINNLINGQGNTSAVPEPASLALLGLAGVLLVMHKRRTIFMSAHRNR